MRFLETHRVPGGHRFFVDSKHPTQIAVADASGHTPDETDDGILYIDPGRPLYLSKDRNSVGVPLLTEKGKETSMSSSVREALWIAATLNMPFLDPDSGKEYFVK